MTRGPLIHLSIALVVLAAAVVAYVIWYGTVSRMHADAAALSAEAQSAALAAEEITSARAALSKIAEDEAYFGSYFVSTSTVVSYLEEIEAVGDALGTVVEVVSVTPQGKTRLSVSFRATGAFASVMRTIGAIEYGAHDAVIGNLNLDTNASSEGRWTATGVVSVGMVAGAEEAPKEATSPATNLDI